MTETVVNFVLCGFFLGFFLDEFEHSQLNIQSCLTCISASTVEFSFKFYELGSGTN